MPYVTCPRCALTAYTAARWTTTDDCPACGTPLAGAPRSSVPAGELSVAWWVVSASSSPGLSDHTSSVSTG